MIAVRSMCLATAAIVVGLSFATSAEAQFRGGFGRGGLGGGFARGGGFAGTRFGAVPRFGGVGRGAFGRGFARRGGLGFAGPGRGFRPAFARGRFGAGWRGRGFVTDGGGFDASDGIGIGLAILGTLLSQ